ncbi:Vegetative incompatibility protein HET-E-1 [Cytospora mali]|uniref:Vegetative incompatibility protein HET-E-1 n=1 Tax=Cytospora mali TaxID=578113 RepID=A0A194V5P6_CYTMA|nr:Vegetative incompatibility protein HET-E-1 [Valsa mali var. pyri (nom. inval.)]
MGGRTSRMKKRLKRQRPSSWFSKSGRGGSSLADGSSVHSTNPSQADPLQGSVLQPASYSFSILTGLADLVHRSIPQDGITTTTTTTVPEPDASHLLPERTGAVAAAEVPQETEGHQGATNVSSLWDKAYDALSDEKHDLVVEYEDLLSRVIVRAPNAAQIKSPAAPTKTEDNSIVANQISQHNPAARRAKLEHITELGLQHARDKNLKTTLLGHEIVVQDAGTGAAKVLGQAMSFVKEAIQDLPYASLVTAGISLILPPLKNPAVAEEANRTGFTYVTSRIQYYTAMESLLFQDGLNIDAKDSLLNDLIDLYTHIIEFQVQSILWFYRRGTKNFLREAINYDGWDKKLKDIKDRGTALVSNCHTAIFGGSLQELSRLASQAEDLSKIVSILQSIHQDPKNAACLRSLRITDPRDDKSRIVKMKGGLLQDSYQWIFENDEFKVQTVAQ